ncbi:hypothetical protein JB92DRAFT_3110247 [Gautieria morchelliformis]|nr:hypothetical protein JB92DRAFT_3110247 [Gautieria morchelliformis]
MSQPREGDTFRSLYLPQSFYETSVDRNGLHPGYPQPYYTQAHPSENHSITPTSDMSPPSRFSPTTPTVGKGRGFDLERGDQTSLGSSRGAECQCRHEKRNFRNTILLAALAVLMLVVISNVIFLDVRLMTNSNNSVNPINNTATMPNNSRPSATTSPSRSLSSTGLPSPTANNNVVAAPLPPPTYPPALQFAYPRSSQASLPRRTRRRTVHNASLR